MQNNLFVSWLVENFKRVTAKSPLFFKVWTGISGFLVALTGLPALIKPMLIMIHVTLPAAWVNMGNTAISYVSLGIFFMSLFPAQGNLNSISPQGVVNSQVNPKKLPFTNVVQIKTAIKEGKPTEIDPTQAPLMSKN